MMTDHKRKRSDEPEWKRVCSVNQRMRMRSEIPSEGYWAIEENSGSGYSLKLTHERTKTTFVTSDVVYPHAMRECFSRAKEAKGRYRLRFRLSYKKQEVSYVLEVITGDSPKDVGIVVRQEWLVSSLLNRNIPIHPPDGIEMRCIKPQPLCDLRVPFLNSSIRLHPHQVSSIKTMIHQSEQIDRNMHSTKSKSGTIDVEDQRGMAVDVHSGRVIREDNSRKREIQWMGGVLADLPGSGKTCVMQSFTMIDMKREAKGAQKRSVCNSLVVLSRNLVDQWVVSGEKFFGSALKILTFTTVSDVKKRTWEDVKNADMVICTNSFIKNTYKDYVKTVRLLTGGDERLHMEKASRVLKSKLSSPGIKEIAIHPLLIGYRSLIVDEIDELLKSDTRSYNNRLFECLMSVSSQYRWLMTGTPSITCTTQLRTYACLLRKHAGEFVVSMSGLEAKDTRAEFYLPDTQQNFVNTCFIRHEPDMGLPPLQNETHMVKLTRQEELVLYGAGTSNMSRYLQLCSYSAEDSEHEKWQSMEDITSKMLSKMKRRVTELEKRNSIMEVENRSYKDRLRLIPEYTDDADDNEGTIETIAERRLHESSRASLVRLIKERDQKTAENSKEIEDVRRRISYIETQLNEITSDSGSSCSICMEKPDVPAILPCAHYLCMDCAKEALRRQHKCPMCRTPATLSQVLFVRPDGTEVAASRFGSKISEMMKCVTSIVDKKEQCVIFVQFTSLASRITMALQELGVKVSILEKSSATRTKRIKELRSKKLSALVLSLEDSAAGIDLSCASHVIFSHALYDPISIDTSTATMNQAIARVYRAGQTAPSVHVHHFITKGTKEESLHARLTENVK